MNVNLLPLVQGAGAVALAVVAFSFALTWPSVVGTIQAFRSERIRLLGFVGLGLAMLASAALLYLVPGLLLRDELALLISFPLGATWVIAAIALIVRGMLLDGAARVISYSFAVVSVSGLGAGIASALCAQHRIADTITPTGAFLLALTAVAGVVFWSNSVDRMARA
ncbi:hypothetical protein [Leifsonia sp. Le1]|uniref:hypothetical protein n=1 Tax=Leifsonia sp. Le1 TaxID=3404918 RepID=UPI003EB7CD8F